MLLTWVCFQMMKKGKKRFEKRHSGFDEIVARLSMIDDCVTYSSPNQRSRSVKAFEEIIAQWLREAYSPPLVTAQTHTGCVDQGSEQCAHESDVRGRPLHTLARTTSTAEPELELESGPFFERSAMFLRLKKPYGTGRGYARKQPFKAQDIRIWERIRDWQKTEEDETDLLSFINYWFECDFTWEALEHLFALDPKAASFNATLAGDAQACDAVVDSCIDEPCVQVEWSCRMCKDDGKPTLNSVAVLLSHDFCRLCRTTVMTELFGTAWSRAAHGHVPNPVVAL